MSGQLKSAQRRAPSSPQLSWILRLAGSPRFHAMAARIPLLRRFVRAEGAAMFSIISGFVQSQVLMAIVELDLLTQLDQPRLPAELAGRAGVTADRMAMLLQAGAALGLFARMRDGRYRLAPRGAAFRAVPGLSAMVRHHAVLYRDLSDPVAFLRGETRTELAEFWPYVFGAAGAVDPEVTATYSDLMADSQGLVAADTLALVNLSGSRMLLDVGGGSGAFLAAVGQAHPSLQLALFDLPAVAPQAESRLRHAGVWSRTTLHSGSFRDDPLPQGADTISLIRVLYDHSDNTVAALLAKVHAALQSGGQLIISEPMSGGAQPDPATDVYFAFYTAAMRTGRTRSLAEIAELLRGAGFVGISPRPGHRPFVTSAITARKA
jgi:demethylspheroidene O-methyltransferase